MATLIFHNSSSCRSCPAHSLMTGSVRKSHFAGRLISTLIAAADLALSPRVKHILVGGKAVKVSSASAVLQFRLPHTSALLGCAGCQTSQAALRIQQVQSVPDSQVS